MKFALFFFTIVLVLGQRDEIGKKIIEELKNGVESLNNVKRDLENVIWKPKPKDVVLNQKDVKQRPKVLVNSEEGPVNVEKDCGGGVKVKRDQLIDTCTSGKRIGINEFYQNERVYNASLTNVSSIQWSESAYVVKEMFIEGSKYATSDFGYSSCVINRIEGEGFVSDADIDILCGDAMLFTEYYFGYDCSTNNVVCDGKRIPNYMYDTTDFKQYKKCDTVSVLCNPDTVCYNNTVVDCPTEFNCNLTYSGVEKCSKRCEAVRTVYTCECPEDKTGQWCEKQGDLTCEISKVESNALGKGQEEFLDRGDPNKDSALRVYQFDGKKAVEMKFKVECTNEISQNTTDSWFISTEELKISSDPNRTLIVSVINFYNLADRSETFKVHLGAKHYTGEESVTVELPLDFLQNSKSWNGDTMYAEVQITPPFTTTSFSINRFYIQREHKEDKYNRTVWIKTNWWWILIIFVVLALCVFVCGWYYYKNTDVFARVKDD
ncbi:hypothetical protein EIN_398280 [Entamoeba invadens IP1]|uniref:EGF-like domain-containing protein n=1 Tax=Entamoeba invadens IP1 TaxID=370355 RepID=A0A0A1UA17_ENTIV|nr:hypothetical protein EIN_398280 [Entamoeba invadens IP1]ELP91898.1 hypothetical protein EIN_398280 [Entamoeba invadens IP1]|eukprot:XP_004258669.1 hypothetical protein EIN_398280 [Entamoeba invadens IP1]